MQRCLTKEVALTLRGKKRKLNRKDWIEYFGSERLLLPPKIIDKVLHELSEASSAWLSCIEESFLSANQKVLYAELLAERFARHSIRLDS